MARVVVLTPNPAIDVTYRVAEQVIGDTVRVLAVVRRAGGKGINVVRVLTTLGVEATAIQPLGGASGEWMRAELEADGVRQVSITTAVETRSTVAVVDNIAHPTLLAESGSPLDAPTWRALTDAVTQQCERGGFLVIAGSFPPETSTESITALVAAGRAAGAAVLVDSSGPALIAAAVAGVDIIKPNAAEVLGATGAENLPAGLRQLLDLGAGCVIVSRGRDGLLSVAAETSGEILQPGVPGVSGNPTGAGDAATAGLVSALVAGSSLRDAMRRAAVVGAAAVLAPEAGEIDPEVLLDLDRRLDGPS
jgi:tagatose 6-phosphate kinase